MTLVEGRLLMRPKEVAESLGIGLSKTYELLASGELPSIRVGRSIRIPVAELHDWVRARQEERDESAP